ncbi:hypothetical protein AW168_33115 [Nocardia brasiliensis]|uniref:S-adenosyl-L-methionine-dependent methyltransferase n=1 Tax=Nocardia brasiliensis (strain ATCC 700358 / HUJEG-1) TaxID=1133849 RepID=K0F651_NOCB7|nr:hypothetical protein O3I_024900 [Nocardia brasiliensis ATCC 700358]OCF86005.1 hypothetical protein AW168_33115 [Nocardia brasiliensis]
MQFNSESCFATEVVGRTALVVAMARALETRSLQRMIDDPWAERFLAAAGVEIFAPRSVGKGRGVIVAGAHLVRNFVAVRTRFVDNYVSSAVAANIRQIVILGAGLDARVLRLPLPRTSRLTRWNGLR